MKTKVTFERTKTGPVARFGDDTEVNPGWVTGTEILANLGLKEGTTATVIVDEPEAYEWEWRNGNVNDDMVGLWCVFYHNPFSYVKKGSPDSVFEEKEAMVKKSISWRPGDRIRPRPKKPSFADVIEKAGFEVAQGGQSIALARGHYAFTRDILKAAEIIAQYQKDYPDTWAELVKGWEK